MHATEPVKLAFHEMLSVDVNVLSGSAEVFQRGFSVATEASGGDRLAAVRATMRALEQLWDVSQPVAGCLMMWLMREAARCKAHDVYDAITLYLSSSSDEALASALDGITRAIAAPRFRNLAQSYASNIRQKVALRR